MRSYRLTDPAPASLTQTKIWRLAQRLGHSRCFYSNIECLFYDAPIKSLKSHPRAATREHLIPKGRCTFTDLEARDNVVICSSFMNNLLGDAPLMVKIEVRNEIFRHQTKEYDEIENIARNILDAYRIGNRFPWQVASFEKNEADRVKQYVLEMQELELKTFKALAKLRTIPVQPIITWSNNGRTDAVEVSQRPNRPEHLSPISYPGTRPQ